MSTTSTEVAGQHDIIGVATGGSMPQGENHPGAAWFKDACLGLFIHWGISSVRGEGDLSWSMMYRPEAEWQGRYTLTPPAQYWAQANDFNPRHYDPDKWLRTAKDAGFTYAVLTTKHHDGYSLWPSEFGEFSTRTHMNGRDLVGEFIAACRRNGLKVGLYYSPPDWYFDRHVMSFRYGGKQKFPELPDIGHHFEEITLPERADAGKQAHREQFRSYTRGQVEELLTRYGPIDVLWFDGGSDAVPLSRIRELQPNCLVNNRAHGEADFDTKEVVFPKERPQGLWEFCSLWNGGVEMPDGAWGYLKHEKHRPTGAILTELVKSRAWGGNYLPNVGPNSDGELPDNAYLGLAELQTWMGHSGESVRNTQGGLWPESSNVPHTRRNGVHYFHLLPGDESQIVVSGVDEPSTVKSLRSGRPVPFEWQEGTLKVSFPRSERTQFVDVVKVEITTRT